MVKKILCGFFICPNKLITSTSKLKISLFYKQNDYYYSYLKFKSITGKINIDSK